MECPFRTDLSTLNFDEDELGDDETEFTETVMQEIRNVNHYGSKKSEDKVKKILYKEFYHENAFTPVHSGIIQSIFKEDKDKDKEVPKNKKTRRG